MIRMNDTLGRKITYLRLSVTDLCDLRCIYCMPEHGVPKRAHSEICSLEELCDMAAAAVSLGVRKVRITGGEPLIRRGVVSLCQMLRALPGLEELCLTTNGVRLPELAAPLREAGVDRLNISLDTLRPERYRSITRIGELSSVLRGLDAAEAAGFSHTKLNCVLMGGVNDDEIEDFVRLTQACPLSVRFIELMPMGACAKWEKARFLPAGAVLDRVPELEPAGTDGVSRNGRADRADEPRLLRRMQPHPHHRRRQAQALPARGHGNCSARASRRGASRRHPPGHCAQAGASCADARRREPCRTLHE